MFKKLFKTKAGMAGTGAKTAKTQAGFTLFEMLVSAAIIVIISSIVLFNHNKFNTDIEITNLAYRMAIAAREAQVYGISVRQFDQSGSFNVPYGLHFSREIDNSYILFADGDNDGLYNGDDQTCNIADECLEKVTIGRGNRIKGWCGILWENSSTACFYTGDLEGDVDYNFIDIKFRRPNPDATFQVFDGDYVVGGGTDRACWNNGATACTGWAVCLISPEGKEKRVVIYNTGQISVENVEEGGACSTS